MKYENTCFANFLERCNRFSALVEINGVREIVHVKNTGRCRELLQPGKTVMLQRVQNSARKTQYDLISVYKDGLGWVNIDSQAPNHVVREWLESGESIFGRIDFLRPEFTYGSSRMDFYLECAKLMGLEKDEVVVFEDALYCGRTLHQHGFTFVGIHEPTIPEEQWAELASLCNKTVEDYRELL